MISWWRTSPCSSVLLLRPSSWLDVWGLWKGWCKWGGDLTHEKLQTPDRKVSQDDATHATTTLSFQNCETSQADFLKENSRLNVRKSKNYKVDASKARSRLQTWSDCADARRARVYMSAALPHPLTRRNCGLGGFSEVTQE